MKYTLEHLQHLESFYSDQLLNNTIPFWFPRSYDEEYGGFLLMRDRDGTLLDDDKQFGYREELPGCWPLCIIR
jgi:N-acylglucosamine 2-epimerase